jgi:hypothetical protein
LLILHPRFPFPVSWPNSIYDDLKQYDLALECCQIPTNEKVISYESHIQGIEQHTHTRIYDHNNLGLNVKRKHNKRKHVWSKISHQKTKDDLTTRIYDIWSREWRKEKKEKRKYLGMPSKKYIRERNISLYFR